MPLRLHPLRLTLPVAVLVALCGPAGPAAAVVSPDGPSAPYGQPGDARPASGLLAVGDLDGNGVKDVLESRELAGTEGRARDIGLIARDGRRGVELWRRTVRLQGHEALTLRALRRAGSNRPAALMTIEGSREVDGQTRQTRRLLGLDLMTNTVVWRTSAEDVRSTGPDTSDRCAPCTVHVGLVPARSGPGQDVLLAVVRSRTARTGPPAYEGGPPRTLTPPADVQLARLETAGGRVLPIGEGVTTDSPHPQAELTPDLDGDRRDDVLLRGETGRTTTAVSTATGAVLWHSDRLPYSSSAVSRSAPSADGSRDLLVPTWEGTTADDHDERPVYTQPQVALLDSATGQVRWRRAGVAAQPVGSTAGLPVVAVLDMTLERGRTSTSTAAVTALDRDGTARWRTQDVLTSSRPGAELNALGVGTLQDAGDTDGDGQRELLLVHRFEEGGGARQQTSAVLHGATGDSTGDVGDPSGFVSPLLAPLTGTGADLVSTRKTGSQALRLDGLDGSSGAPRWSRSLPGTATSGARFAAVDAVRLHGSGCRSLLVTTYPRTVHAVVRGDGVPAWTVVPSASTLFGTQLVPGTAAHAAC